MTRLFTSLEKAGHHQKQIVKGLRHDLALIQKALKEESNTSVVNRALSHAQIYITSELDNHTKLLLQYREAVGDESSMPLDLSDWCLHHHKRYRHRSDVIVKTTDDWDCTPWHHAIREAHTYMLGKGKVFTGMSIGEVVDSLDVFFDGIEADIKNGTFPKDQIIGFTFFDFHNSDYRDQINVFLEKLCIFAGRHNRPFVVILALYKSEIIKPRKNLFII